MPICTNTVCCSQFVPLKGRAGSFEGHSSEAQAQYKNEADKLHFLICTLSSRHHRNICHGSLPKYQEENYNAFMLKEKYTLWWNKITPESGLHIWITAIRMPFIGWLKDLVWARKIIRIFLKNKKEIKRCLWNPRTSKNHEQQKVQNVQMGISEKKEQIRKKVEEITKNIFSKLIWNITAYSANSENTKQNEG